MTYFKPWRMRNVTWFSRPIPGTRLPLTGEFAVVFPHRAPVCDLEVDHQRNDVRSTPSFWPENGPTKNESLRVDSFFRCARTAAMTSGEALPTISSLMATSAEVEYIG